MKILVVGLNFAPEQTGVAPYTTGLSKGLVARGHAVRVITAMPHYPEWRISAEYGGMRREDRIGGVRVTRLRHYVPTHPSAIRRVLSEVSFGLRSVLIQWGHPDVVVLVSPALFASAIALLRGRLLGKPVVVWVQDIYSLGLSETRRGRALRLVGAVSAVESSVLRRAQGVAVIHDRFRDVVERLGVAADRAVVIRNWTHVRPYAAEDRQGVRRRFGWNEDEVIVLHSGAMGRKQDLDNVVRAARVAERRGERLRFVLMGNGGERRRLEESARDLATATFLDPVPSEEFQKVLAAVDVLLVNEHAGLREMAVPSKLTSYFSSGRPVLAATDPDSVTASEVAASGGGVRVDPGQPELLVNAVLDIAGDATRAARIGAAGLRYRQTVLSEKAALDRYTRWLEQIATRHRRPGPLTRLRTRAKPDQYETKTQKG